MMPSSGQTVRLGDLISLIYEKFLVRYNRDEELASIATAAVINDLITRSPKGGNKRIVVELDN